MTLPSTPSAVRAATFLAELGVSHVVTVPDNTSAPLLSALHAAGDPAEGGASGAKGVRVVMATREGEAISLASGLWLGGSSPAVLIQNTGLLEAGDGLRGTASRMGVPLLLLVTLRGYAKARNLGMDPGQVALDRDMLVREDLDSVAPMTEPTLRAWGIPWVTMSAPDDLASIRSAWVQAHEEERPVAVLVDTSFSAE